MLCLSYDPGLSEAKNLSKVAQAEQATRRHARGAVVLLSHRYGQMRPVVVWAQVWTTWSQLLAVGLEALGCASARRLPDEEAFVTGEAVFHQGQFASRAYGNNRCVEGHWRMVAGLLGRPFAEPVNPATWTKQVGYVNCIHKGKPEALDALVRLHADWHPKALGGPRDCEHLGDAALIGAARMQLVHLGMPLDYTGASARRKPAKRRKKL